MNVPKLNLLHILIPFYIFSCQHQIKTERDETFSWKNDYVPAYDFCKGLRQQVEYLRNKKDHHLKFADRQIPTHDYLIALTKITEECKASPQNLPQFLEKHFEPYEIHEDGSTNVLLTSYFEPVLEGMSEPVHPYTMPLYNVPQDLVRVELENYKSYGRLKKSPTSQQYSVVPYAKRSDIDKKVLKNATIHAWVKPIEGFFMHIQGSGQVKLKDKKTSLRLGYASQNGHAFYPIGRSLLDVIPRKSMSMDTIKDHLSSLPTPEAFNIMHQDPSYVFFQRLSTRPLTSNNTEVIDGHTIATDNKYFSKGLLGALVFKHPVDNTPQYRLILNQDTGGAIKGPRRVDLFWGTGDEAGFHAGRVLQNDAKLVYFLPTERALQKWRQQSQA